MGFDFDVQHKKGKENVDVDALSRKQEDDLPHLMAISIVSSYLLQQIKDNWLEDTHLLQLMARLIQQGELEGKYKYQEGLLHRKDKLLVGNSPDLRHRLIKLFHSSPMGGHLGVHAMTKRLASELYWKRLRKQARDYIRNYLICL